MPLADKAIRAAQTTGKNYKLADEKGLFLLVHKNGSKYWRFKYRFNGKEKLISFGVYPEVTLKEARLEHEKARQLLRKGIDPSANRKAKGQASKAAEENSFERVALEWFNKQTATWSESQNKRVTRLLHKDLFPRLRSRPIAEISTPELLDALEAIQARGAIETARRARQIASRVFRYAIATRRAEHDPAQALIDALAKPEKSHMAAVTDPKSVGPLLNVLDSYEGTIVVQCALRLAPLTFVRPSELRTAKWADIDWEREEWRFTISKTKTEHIVPLSRQALAILSQLQPFTCNSEYIFPSARTNKRPMSDNAVLAAMRRMGIAKNEMSGHGFRAMARTILDEELEFRVDWIEHQLGHAVKDANGRAYNRTAHLKGRKKMMQAWADYLDNLKAEAANGNVIAGNFKNRR